MLFNYCGRTRKQYPEETNVTVDPASPTKIDMKHQHQRTLKRQATKTTKADDKEDIESLLHLEALAAVGLSEKELEEKKRLDYEAKRKLGIVFTDQLEKHRAKNTDNLIKVHITTEKYVAYYVVRNIYVWQSEHQF
jgi:hypothetical protein